METSADTKKNSINEIDNNTRKNTLENTVMNTLKKQRDYFRTGKTKSFEFRNEQLKKLLGLIVANEAKIYKALKEDLSKPDLEIFSTEFGFVLHDLKNTIKNLRTWMKPKKVGTGLVSQPGHSTIYRESLGVCLIISPWNYPFQLAMSPLISAMAAGNTAIVKPSELTPKISKVMAELINTNFPQEYLHVVEGGVEASTELLKHRFDKIFFTGSTAVGKIVARAAAEHLTPVTLELGGKSPAIICKDADLKVTARRIVWGKFINAGQTCVAPDFLYVDKAIEDELMDELEATFKEFYPQGQTLGENYTRIVSRKHFDRLVGFLSSSKVAIGGKNNPETLFIEPSIIQNVTWQSPIMQEEIFGPLLPVLSFKNLPDAIEDLKTKEKPLALYLFSNSSVTKDMIIQELSFGGGTMNDTLMHLSNTELPFGGVGESGFGAYHGEAGFLCFSHQKSVMDRATWVDPNLRYPPYTSSKEKWLKRLL